MTRRDDFTIGSEFLRDSLVLAAAVLLSGCNPFENSTSNARVHLTAAPGLSVPSLHELARQLEGTLDASSIAKKYVYENGKLVEVKPEQATKPKSAVVRSFDTETGVAYVDLRWYSEYKMPLFQIWRFDGKTWSDSIDSGISVRLPSIGALLHTPR